MALTPVLTKHLSQEMNQRNWTITELARRAHVCPSFLNRLMNGKITTVSLDTIEKLGKALHLPVTTLLER